MKARNICLVIILCLGISSMSLADEISKRGKAEQLLLQFKVDKSIEQLIDQAGTIQANMMMGAELSNEEINGEQIINDSMIAIMKKEMSWEKIKDDYIDVYAEVFTENEINDLISMFNTPAGKKYIEKMPLLGAKSMEIGQKYALKILPEVYKKINESNNINNRIDNNVKGN